MAFTCQPRSQGRLHVPGWWHTRAWAKCFAVALWEVGGSQFPFHTLGEEERLKEVEQLPGVTARRGGGWVCVQIVLIL